MDQLRCPCCGGYLNPHEWDEARQWLNLIGIDFDLDGTIDTKGAARLLSKAVQTLENWRSRGEGPQYSKDAHGRIRYQLDDLISFREGFQIEPYNLTLK